MKKKFLALLLSCAMLCALAACGGEPASSGSGNGDAAGGLKLTLVVADKFGDRSFYDSSKEGADRLVKDKGITLSTIECGGENHTAQMRNAADSSKAGDVVVCVGWEFNNIETVAPGYPDVKWIWIDNATENPVATGRFVVGAVGGEDSDTINDFIVGYEQGAKYYADENGKTVNVVKNYANTYTDPAMGKECAIALNDQGADVVFQIASATGDGVFEAAKEKSFYAIGVDSDQKYIDPDTIICSMKKEVGSSIYDAVSTLMGGDDSRWGGTWVADMSTGYVGIGYGEDGAAQQVSDEVKSAVEELAKKISAGEIKVDTTR